MSVVECLVNGMVSGSQGEPSVILMDLLGYDGWPAAFAISKSAAGNLVAVDSK